MAREKKVREEAALPAITPEDFKRFLEGLVLEDVCLVKCEASRTDQGASTVLAGDLEYGERAHLAASDDRHAEVLASFAVRVLPGDGEGNPVAQLAVTYRVRYAVREEMTPACFEQFRNVSLRVHTVPFAREWIRETSARLGLKPIVLPMAITHPAAVAPAAKKPTRKKTAASGS